MDKVNATYSYLIDENIKNAIISRKFLRSVQKNVNNNKVISDYYSRYTAEETVSKKQRIFFYDRAERVKYCNSTWVLDRYERSKVKNFKKTYLCKDKFCSNCKKVKQAIRSKKYLPELVKYDNDLYFLTLTVPNVSDNNLSITLNTMQKAFGRFIRLMNGRDKIKGVDFQHFGFLGAVRSLEITYKPKIEYDETGKEKINKNRFHPHFHAAIILKDYMPGKAYIQNRYSVDNLKKKNTRLFTNDEILIQKIWYLLINNIEVNKNNLSEYQKEKKLKNGSFRKVWTKNLGYSATLDRFKPGQYAEVFKYMIKDKDQDGNIMDYDTFKTLMVSLNRIRQLQGYGVLYNIEDDEDKLDENVLEEVDREVETFLFYLELIEPNGVVEQAQSIEEVIFEKDFTIITKKKLFNVIKINRLNEQLIERVDEEVRDKQINLSVEEIEYYKNISKLVKNENIEKDKILRILQGNTKELIDSTSLNAWIELIYKTSIKSNESYASIAKKWGVI